MGFERWLCILNVFGCRNSARPSKQFLTLSEGKIQNSDAGVTLECFWRTAEPAVWKAIPPLSEMLERTCFGDESISVSAFQPISRPNWDELGRKVLWKSCEEQNSTNLIDLEAFASEYRGEIILQR